MKGNQCDDRRRPGGARRRRQMGSPKGRAALPTGKAWMPSDPTAAAKP